jgi:hypothetical protein
MAIHSPVKDDGGYYFEIIPTTRQVKVPNDQKAIGVVGDHLSEQLTFRCPRLIDSHDVSGCARKYVSWVNVDGEPGNDELQVSRVEDEYLYLTWDVRNALTVAVGLVKFSVVFEDLAEDGTTPIYRWGTTTNQSCEVLDAISSAVGAYEAIYVDGDVLVISDYTPVRNMTAEFLSGLVPEGTLIITEEGKHDVGPYASVDVRTSGEAPEITVENGVITAEVHGLKTTMQLETPVISVAEDGTITATANGLSSVLLPPAN